MSIVVDTSAVIAVVLEEPEKQSRFFRLFNGSPQPIVFAITDI